VGEHRLAGSADQLRSVGQLRTKVGDVPVVVFWHDQRPWAIEDRCPHLGFPLHRGSVESGLVTCHWHHARFDLASGCTLDPWADDAVGFDAEVSDGDVLVSPRKGGDPVEVLLARLESGLEDRLDLVLAKAVLGLLDHGVAPRRIVEVGLRFGTRYRERGWGSGLTILVAMANLLPVLRPEDRALALFHGLREVAVDTAGHAPRFPQRPLGEPSVPVDRLRSWYRRFVDTRSADAAERTLATAIAGGAPLDEVEAMLVAAVTDHLFLDGGHTLDFTNKAVEALAHLDEGDASVVLTSLVAQTAVADRAEDSGAWRHPDDLVALAATELEPGAGGHPDLAGLARRLLAEDPAEVVDALVAAAAEGASDEELARAVALAGALRVVRFHVSNDHSDWDTVHHSFTYANAVHRHLRRAPGAAGRRAVVQGALKVYLDRFLNVPAALLPEGAGAALDELAPCWDQQGHVDEAGSIAYRFVRGGGDPAELIAALAGALLREDAGFHWFQMLEAGSTQAREWPDGSEEQALVLTAVARFLAAHTPTRRTRHSTYAVADRLRRGEPVFEAPAAR
jgi:nitrite reductase/ring-hydroxylating ferredoxin subunit